MACVLLHLGNKTASDFFPPLCSGSVVPLPRWFSLLSSPTIAALIIIILSSGAAGTALVTPLHLLLQHYAVDARLE